MSTLREFLIEVQTLRIEVKVERVAPYLSVDHYLEPGYEMELDRLQQNALSEIRLLEAEEIKRIQIRFDKFWSLYSEHMEEFYDPAFLRLRVYPLFLGVNKNLLGTITPTFIHHLHDCVVIKEGMFDDLVNYYYRGSFLKSLKEIGGFYWYLEASGENHDFVQNADNIVKDYGRSSGKKAIHFYNSFIHDENRVEGDPIHIQTLQTIVNEMKRLKKDVQLALNDLTAAKQEYQLQQRKRTPG